ESTGVASGSLAMAYPDSEEAIQEQEIVINTGKARITLTNRGGDVIGYELLEHLDGESGVEMADNVSERNRAFSVSFGGPENGIIQDLFHVKKIDDYTVGFYKTYQDLKSGGTYIFAKQYTFKPDDYMFKLDITVEGAGGMNGLSFGDAAYTIRTSPQIGPYFNAKTNKYENRTFMSFDGNKKKKQILGAGKIEVYDKEYTWTGVGGKYFEILGIPVQPGSMMDVEYSTEVEVNDYANAQVLMTRKAIMGASTQDSYYFYVGPRTEKDLKIYNSAEDNPWGLSGLKLNESLESTGILSWLETILKWCMELIYKVIPNWGVSIIILTILIKILLFPLTKKSSMGTLKMQEIQPRMQELQEKYRDQPEKLNMEMSKLYKETGYNPLSGCLPLLIQFPLIFAMYNLFNNYFEFRGAMFIPGWIPDLSVGDIVPLPVTLPIVGNQLHLLPVIYLASQLLFGKITQASATGSNSTQMKIMMYGMPIMFFFIFYNAPAGLLLYWTVSNVLQLFQQMMINKMMKAKRAEMELNKVAEKKVFVPRKKK
ncbi:MAG: YidC/Oxa1 family insertase periplasmic-domain containing protein, partial [Spirochaetaceae bacterium]|nr:YidC/Oxa1 family insertase periplasmic-domain containing protein [Spirochaetaceae bacterium]